MSFCLKGDGFVMSDGSFLVFGFDFDVNYTCLSRFVKDRHDEFSVKPSLSLCMGVL